MSGRKLIERALRRTRETRRKETFKRFFLAAVGVRADGAIVSAFNHDIMFPTPSGHAEARLAQKLTPNSEVAVARITRGGDQALARPCPLCCARLRNKGITRVWYTTEDGYDMLELV